MCGCACVFGEGGIEPEKQKLPTLSSWWLTLPQPNSFVQYCEGQ
jgi:hypothetical protein